MRRERLWRREESMTSGRNVNPCQQGCNRLPVLALIAFAVPLPQLRVLVLPLRPRPHPPEHFGRRRQVGPPAHPLPPPARNAAPARREDGGGLGTTGTQCRGELRDVDSCLPGSSFKKNAEAVI